MTKMEIMLIILGVAFLFLAGFFIPALLQIRRTAKGMAETLQHLNEGLPLIMKNLEEITSNINRTTTTVHLQVAELSLTLRRIQGVLGVFLGLEEVLRRRLRFPFSRTLQTSLAVARGIRAFIECLVGTFPEERHDKTPL
ncbi:MAG: DUF948 domain-containing protein, partial [Deltaproteobacteria bacterium]|nr:DUF948 domain-containing protein [Deltaproteobacteria bacterium]